MLTQSQSHNHKITNTIWPPRSSQAASAFSFPWTRIKRGNNEEIKTPPTGGREKPSCHGNQWKMLDCCNGSHVYQWRESWTVSIGLHGFHCHWLSIDWLIATLTEWLAVVRIDGAVEHIGKLLLDGSGFVQRNEDFVGESLVCCRHLFSEKQKKVFLICCFKKW